SYATSAVPAIGEAVGVYRLLAGAGYTTVGFAAEGVTYTGVPTAVAPKTYNQSEALNQVRVAYGNQATGGAAKWGQWCSSCHANMHESYNGGLTHPVDRPLAEIAGLYNSYVSSGIMTGDGLTAFLSLVPFAQNSGDFATLADNASNTDTALAGPTISDEVMCLSCHRAHASGFSNMLRWNNDSEFMVENGTYTGGDPLVPTTMVAMGRTEAEFEAAYYDRPATDFSAFQRDLCNKCHAKD
ncbi:MAG: cytochrome C, partial [Deltaproteobacteria bacterium]|nr:cytochrome C [Deltaproteobacteria bacterium]